MKIFLINTDNQHAESLMHKLADVKRDRQFVQLNQGEMDLYLSGDFKTVYLGNETNQKIIEVDKEKSYIFFLDPEKDNLEDAVNACNDLDLNAKIIRTTDDGIKYSGELKDHVMPINIDDLTTMPVGGAVRIK